jgi:hypothetical protein
MDQMYTILQRQAARDPDAWHVVHLRNSFELRVCLVMCSCHHPTSLDLHLRKEGTASQQSVGRAIRRSGS